MLGCIVLGEKNAFPVDFDTGKTIGHLKRAIKEQAGLAGPAHKLILWKVNIPESKKQEIYEGIDIKVKFRGEELDSDLKTIGQVFKEQPSSEHIHIIVELPKPTTTGSGQLKSLKTVEEIIEEISKNLKKRKSKPKSPNQLDMPLQHREFREALVRVEETTRANVEGVIGNLNYWCFVSSGAPGIGKTRFGMELFDHIQKNWKPPQEWNDVHFEYLYMDFGTSLYLDDYDCELIPTVIFGLRIAYVFFMEKNYYITFQVFRSLVLAYGNDIFFFESVINYCYKSLKFSNNQKLFLYLHIDKFHKIDAWDAKNKTKELFKNMIRNLAKYMLTENLTFIQPFLSGTAPRAIAEQKKTADISFQFVDCPLLDNASIIRIMDHFATKFKAPTENHVYKWKFCVPLIQLLMDTGGLPRALEQLFTICFMKLCDNGEEFFRELESHDYDNIFTNVKGDLEKMYNIYYKVEGNKELAIKLLYHCVEGIPIDEDECLDEKLKITVKDLESDGHFALSPLSPCLYLIEMPFFFICLYNDILKIVNVNLAKTFQVKYWQRWELFVAHHISFRVNLAIKMGKDKLSLRELHPGAYGTNNDLDIIMKLKKLFTYEAGEQFPLSLDLTLKSDGTKIHWKDGRSVVVNGSSAEFADIFLVMEDENGVYYLIMGQNKWDYCSVKMTESNVYKEDDKNLSGIEGSPELQNYQPITIIFTTQPYRERKKTSNILIVSTDNFKSYFGPIFSARATFAFTKAINPNFWEINSL
ncbi:unnamed protein product [Rhizophagus irregularis]|uniref:Uncharacterized protein n=1 Tax=Rhizophagus irregularis TaxID=588596 RepID=A0A2I1FEY2_9GLOM|nr:hypothetical protein RhiirB3_451508 [Rhizophagus irregularis]CAB5359142.1 unnamed protein product [Rhizophagus irregularis]